MRLLPSLSTKLLRAPSFADMRAVDVRQRMQRRTIGVQPHAPYCAGRRNAGEQRQRSTPSPAVFFMFWPPYLPPQSLLITRKCAAAFNWNICDRRLSSRAGVRGGTRQS